MRTKKKSSADYQSVQSCLKAFLLHLELEKSLSENTISAYSYDIKKFSAFLNSLRINSFNEINERIVEKFLAFLAKENKPSTAARTLSSLRQFYDFLLEDNKLESLKSNPLENFDSPKLSRL